MLRLLSTHIGLAEVTLIVLSPPLYNTSFVKKIGKKLSSSLAVLILIT